jgi:D-arabinose 5-phosphate isomerase GutQ
VLHVSSRSRVEALCNDAKQLPAWAVKSKPTPEAVKEHIKAAVAASFSRDANTTHLLAAHFSNPDALSSVAEVCQSIASRAASGNGGTVYVTGIGKSGAVGNRITVSLRSVGVRSSYVHGSEWAHGDLGGLHANDLVVLVSHSGNTAELVHLLSHTQNQGVETVAIVGSTPSGALKSSSSKLALGADAKVHLWLGSLLFAALSEPSSVFRLQILSVCDEDLLGIIPTASIVSQVGFTGCRFATLLSLTGSVLCILD